MPETTVIIGADQGLGLAIAHEFGAHDHKIILVARNQAKLVQAHAKLTAANITSTYLVADIAQLDQIEPLFQTLQAKNETITNLIFNVGDTHLDNSLNGSLATIQQTFQLNVLSAIQAVRAFLNHSTTTQKRAIIFTGGGATIRPTNTAATLSLTKAALRSYALTLHQQLADENVFVSIVTVQGIVGLTAATQPQKIAAAYWQLFSDRQLAELCYPAQQTESEFTQLKQLLKDPVAREQLFQKQPELAAKLKPLLAEK
ncbi:SDR family NAD(P)-dependent oxidoreductase [Loigolactobacillus binensis]|uniref:SDR family NAD(P)-dependent oxidoreductase n=1 Tax=Loigolactobacillus binensis TaxID=2559922 RepID=A0ABW3ECH0_9LACO|nr:SDR family NAD(P)-dependent oxidoreductase [Loigolactobacillus binensis]